MFDYFRIIFSIEAAINIISGGIFIFFPYHQLGLLVKINERNDIQDLLCRWWAALLLMQAAILICAAVYVDLRFYVYIALLVGEVVLVPVMTHYILIRYQGKKFFRTREIIFLATQFVFIALRIAYFILEHYGLAE